MLGMAVDALDPLDACVGGNLLVPNEFKGLQMTRQ